MWVFVMTPYTRRSREIWQAWNYPHELEGPLVEKEAQQANGFLNEASDVD